MAKTAYAFPCYTKVHSLCAGEKITAAPYYELTGTCVKVVAVFDCIIGSLNECHSIVYACERIKI